MTTSSLGERLRKARELGGISARELGRLAGVNESAAWLIEDGRRLSPAVDTIAAFSRVLGVTTDWIILGQGESPTTQGVAAAVKRARRRAEAA